MDGRPNPAGSGSRAWPRPAAAWVAGAVVVLVATTALAARTGVRPGEEGLFDAANGLPRAAGPLLLAVMPVGTSVGAIVLVVLAVVVRRVRLGATALLAWGLGRATSAALKAWVDRPRPTLLLDGVHLRQAQPFDQAFPSAHTTGAVALAVVAGWAFPRARVPALVVAGLVAAARMYVGVHLPLDLLGGAALGLLAGMAATGAVDRWWPATTPTPEATEPRPQPGER